MKQIKLFLLLLTICFLLNSLDYSQVKENNWISIDSTKNNIFIDSTNIIFSGNEIYVWTLEKNAPPLKLESIDKEIHKTKTYYIINKELKRYSIIQIIYYDKNDNVIRSYSYEIKEKPSYYKFNTPILENSIIEKVLKKCLEMQKSN